MQPDTTKPDELIKGYNLEPHPEGGFFSAIHHSAHQFPMGDRYNDQQGHSQRCAMTHIYYLLRGADYSGWHRLKSEELWTFYSGTPLFLHILNPQSLEIQTIRLSDHSDTGNLTYLVPRDHWFSAEVSEKSDSNYSFIGCTVAPGFVYKDWEMASAKDLAPYIEKANPLNQIQTLIRVMPNT